MSVKYPRTGLRGSPQAFPRKLREVLNDPNTQGLHWTKTGEGFVIADYNLFAATNTMFPRAAHASFQRQLNLYGFRKMTHGREAGAYVHPSGHFGRDDPDGVGLIRRHAQPKSGGGGRRRGGGGGGGSGGGGRRRKSKLAASSGESSDESSDESFDSGASSDGDEEGEVEVESCDDNNHDENDEGGSDGEEQSDDPNGAMTDSDESVGADEPRRRSKRLAAQPKKKKPRRHAHPAPSPHAEHGEQEQQPYEVTSSSPPPPPPPPTLLFRGVSALPVQEAAWLSAALLEDRSAEPTKSCEKPPACPSWLQQAAANECPLSLGASPPLTKIAAAAAAARALPALPAAPKAVEMGPRCAGGAPLEGLSRQLSGVDLGFGAALACPTAFWGGARDDAAALDDGLVPSGTGLLRQASVSSDAGWVGDADAAAKETAGLAAAVDAARAAIAPGGVAPAPLQRQSSLPPPPAFKFMKSEELLSSFAAGDAAEAAEGPEEAGGSGAGFFFSFAASAEAPALRVA